MSIERDGGIQVLRGTPATLSVTFYSADDVTDPGTVTVTITDADGVAVATEAETQGEGAAARTYQLTADKTADLTTLTVAWTSPTLGTVTTYAEVVGDLLFSVAEARAFEGGKLSDKWSDSFIQAGRTRITQAFEQICGVSFVPRYRLVTLNGGGGCSMLLPDLRVSAVRSIETRSGREWTAFDEDELLDVLVEAFGRVSLSSQRFPCGTQNVRIGYEYGYERVPLEIRRAALVVLSDSIESNVTERAMSVSDEFGTFRLSTAGIGRHNWFGLPQADSALARYLERVPGIG